MRTDSRPGSLPAGASPQICLTAQPSHVGGGDGAIAEAVHHFERLTADSNLVSLVLHADGRIAYCNGRLLELTGWRREEVEGEDWFEKFVAPSADLRAAFAALLENDPRIWSYGNAILTRGGRHVFIRWSNSVVRSGNGKVVGTASVGQCIYEQEPHAQPSDVASNADEILGLVQRLFSDPEVTAPAFVRLIAEHCAQLASECGARADGADIAQYIRRSFRV